MWSGDEGLQPQRTALGFGRTALSHALFQVVLARAVLPSHPVPATVLLTLSTACGLLVLFVHVGRLRRPDFGATSDDPFSAVVLHHGLVVIQLLTASNALLFVTAAR